VYYSNLYDEKHRMHTHWRVTNCYEYELVINYNVHVLLQVGFLRDGSDPDKNTESVRVDVVPITAAGGGRVKPAPDTALILLGTAAEG